MPKLVETQIVRRWQNRREQLRAEMERMVHERVDEILGQRDGEMFDGDFVSKTVSTEMIRRTTLFDRKKGALYFARWGCKKCGRKRLVHVGLGLCSRCYQLDGQRFALLRKEWDAQHPQHPPEMDAIDEKIRTAKRVFAREEEGQ